MVLCSLSKNENIDIISNDKFIVNKLEPLYINSSSTKNNLFNIVFSVGEDLRQEIRYISFVFRTVNYQETSLVLNSNLYYDNLSEIIKSEIDKNVNKQNVIFIYDLSELENIFFSDYIIIDGIIQVENHKNMVNRIELLFTKNMFIKLYNISRLFNKNNSIINKYVIGEVLKIDYENITFCKAEHMNYIESSITKNDDQFLVKNAFNFNLGKRNDNIIFSFQFNIFSKINKSDKYNIVSEKEYNIHQSIAYINFTAPIIVKNNGILLLGIKNNSLIAILVNNDMYNCILDCNYVIINKKEN